MKEQIHLFYFPPSVKSLECDSVKFPLSDMTRLKIQASIPYLAMDMAGAILSVPAIEFGKLGDRALMIEAEFGEDAQNEMGGYFLLMPTLESYGAIMKSLGL